MRDDPQPEIESWLNAQPRTSLWTTAVNIYEIRFGLESMAGGRRKTSLAGRFARFVDAIDHHVLPFDTAAATHAADLSAARKSKGRTVELRDTMIAGIVLARNATLATRNTRHFSDLSVAVVDPWTA
jgi:predicted nucleic acid-binding protein